MDLSTRYLTCLLLTLVGSWAAYRYSLKDSIWEDQFDEQVDSLSNFAIFFAALLVILFLVLYDNNGYLGSLLDFLSGRRHRSTLVDPKIRVAFFSFAFVFIGLILLLHGFAKMSEFLLARNVPHSKIRSAAIGLVEIQGKVLPEHVLTTPYTKSECVYYRSELEEYRVRSRLSSDPEYVWVTVSTDTHRLPFWAKDETGQILIDPSNAEFLIPQMKSGFLGTEGEDKNDKMFLSTVGDRRYRESFLSPGESICVLGTLAIRKDPSIHKVIQKANDNSKFIISDSSKRQLNEALRWQMLGALSYGGILFIIGLFEILQLSDLL